MLEDLFLSFTIFHEIFSKCKSIDIKIADTTISEVTSIGCSNELVDFTLLGWLVHLHPFRYGDKYRIGSYNAKFYARKKCALARMNYLISKNLRQWRLTKTSI